MVGTLSRVTALLLSVGILLTGHGLQLTLLPLHAQALGWSAYAIGLSGSLYFFGFVLGCVVIPSIVASVGCQSGCRSRRAELTRSPLT